ncbi:hypothetical protein C7I85_22925 [Mesorhizobium soli]|uniref:Uncharacterized protein n=1 Tax=Pseudaminobacter soli (ex Li et al. 2025) TaxID=1295366 RepID=A0A2P7S3U0_9HYPH|nr:hypothetical protein [Mesorhizobium soli]PSJ57094.1 hypothetical protein C7I85_22925 [Mesorhizobium soli]
MSGKPRAQPSRDAISEALGAVRKVFPDLDISDEDLIDAISSEASAAGFDVNYDLPKPSKASNKSGNVEKPRDSDEPGYRADINPKNYN